MIHPYTNGQGKKTLVTLQFVERSLEWVHGFVLALPRRLIRKKSGNKVCKSAINHRRPSKSVHSGHTQLLYAQICPVVTLSSTTFHNSHLRNNISRHIFFLHLGSCKSFHCDHCHLASPSLSSNFKSLGRAPAATAASRCSLAPQQKSLAPLL